MTTDITELAQRLKLEVHRAVSNFNPNMNIKTRDLKELVEALEKAQQRIASQREYYEGVIVDGGKRIAELESCVSNLKVNRPVVYGDGFHEGYWKARSEQSMSSEDENHG
ncbi:hypothetical protein [Klebsiella aerogenes]|nr:hypothetical protein [Klebsiella aerogenes]